jgi:hypothetical protein
MLSMSLNFINDMENQMTFDLASHTLGMAVQSVV